MRPKLSFTPEEMEKRVARFQKMKSAPNLFLDNVLPGSKRQVYNIIGTGVAEDPKALQPAISDVDGFNIQMSRCTPGNGTALHDHDTVEVFFAVKGTWSVKWGDKAEHEIILNEYDTISIPPGVMRYFTNVGNEDGYLMAILGGTDAGRVTWSPDVVEGAKKAGSVIDEKGNLVRTGASLAKS